MNFLIFIYKSAGFVWTMIIPMHLGIRIRISILAVPCKSFKLETKILEWIQIWKSLMYSRYLHISGTLKDLFKADYHYLT